MGENTILIYEIEVDTTEENAQENIRKALADLLRRTADSLDKGIGHGSLFGGRNELVLTSETMHWNHKLVLKIRRIDNG